MILARALVVLSVLALAAVSPALASAASGARLSRSDLAYRGAFLLPRAPSDEETFAYGGTALAYNPANDSLFVVGHDWYQLSAEVTTPRAARTQSPSDLGRAGFLQPFTDATDGAIADTGQDDDKIGGQLVYRGRLYGSVYVYYDAAGQQQASHWFRPSTGLTSGRAQGLFRVGRLGAGFVSGYMSRVPRVWQRRLSGPAMTGNCCIPIISRTSFGPSAFAFDPQQLGNADPTAATPLLYYPQDHHTLGAWDANWDPSHGIEFNGATSIRGLVFPRGTRSLLFIGTQGVGRFCYGEGTSDRSLDGKPTPDGTVYCYDPDDPSKGVHAYPYVPEIWGYDARDLRSVRRGEKRPWQVRPYATWRLHLPFDSGQVGGAAYDPRHDLIYVSQQFGDGAHPLIHAFKVR